MKQCLTDLVDLPPAQLDALVTIADSGSFEAAARHLHLTPSAVSQRIRALENATGQVLIGRGSPCVPTEAGARLVRLGRQLRLVYADALGSDGAADLVLAVNADSLATWFRPVIAEVAAWGDVALRLVVEDQAHSHDLLRRGDAVAAITSDADPVQGCSVTPLGAMTYLPVATPALVARAADRATMPMVEFNEKDDLQRDELGRHRLPAPPVVHRVPSSDDFRAAVEAGLGWGMLPEVQASAGLSDGRLVRLCDHTAGVGLYWQRWKLESPLLDRVTSSIRRHAPA